MGRKNNNISKNHLSTVYLKSSEKIKCLTSEYNDNIKSLKCGRIVPPSRWDGPDRIPKEVRSEHDKTYELFLSITGGHRTRVAAVTLDNMAEDAVAASESLRQILTVSVRYWGPAFVSWLSMLWDTLTRNSGLQWFGISSQFRLKLSRGDEGVGHVCFPGDEGVGRP